MKSALILDVLKIWIKNYGGKYKIIGNRKGDRIDEFLIGDNEFKNTYEIKSNNKIYYIIDYEKNFKNHIQSIISSDLYDSAKVFMNGKWIGIHRSPDFLYKIMRLLKFFIRPVFIYDCMENTRGIAISSTCDKLSF